MNNKLRRRVSFIVSLSLVLTMFTACSKTNNITRGKEVELYNEATSLVSDYYNDIELENSLQCFYVYNYLEYNGYLSSNTNSYSYKDDYEDNSLGIDVLYTPNTTCRHVSEYYMNTLNKTGYEAYCMPGMLNNSDKINHQVVVVKDNEYTTYQDNYNRCMFEKNNDRLESIFDNKVMTPYDKPITNKKLIGTHNSNDMQKKVNELYKDDTDEVTKTYVQQQYDIAYHKMMVVHPEKLEEFKKEYNEKVLSKLK